MTCLHENTIQTKRIAFCLDCDQAIPLEKPSELRYPRPQDNPLQGWRTVDDMPPFDQPYFCAWQSWPTRHRPRAVWTVMRLDAGAAIPPQATHWHHDNLGLPTCGP